MPLRRLPEDFRTLLALIELAFDCVADLCHRIGHDILNLLLAACLSISSYTCVAHHPSAPQTAAAPKCPFENQVSVVRSY
jgi:hypothetical protein